MDYTELTNRLKKMIDDGRAYASVDEKDSLQAIEALQARVKELDERLDCDRAILAARTASMERYMEERDAALAKLETLEKQEPVAEVIRIRPMDFEATVEFKPIQNGHPPFDIGSKLYLAPVPAKTLSEPEITALINKHFYPDMRPDFQHYRAFGKAIETALKGGA